MPSQSRFPWFETGRLLLAGGLIGTVWLLPPSPYLAPAHRPWMLGCSVAFAFWCALGCERRLRTWQTWHRSPLWRLSPQALSRWSKADPLLGQGFLWTDRHTEALEAEIRAVGALPVAPPPRGGTAALQAVGARDEAKVQVPWSEMVGQFGIFGANRSGKSTLMEVLLVQVIAHE